MFLQLLHWERPITFKVKKRLLSTPGTYILLFKWYATVFWYSSSGVMKTWVWYDNVEKITDFSVTFKIYQFSRSVAQGNFTMSNQPDLTFFTLPLLSKLQEIGQGWYLFVHEITDFSVISYFFQSTILKLLHTNMESWKSECSYYNKY